MLTLPAGGGDEARKVINTCSEPVLADTLPSTNGSGITTGNGGNRHARKRGSIEKV